MQEIIFRDLGKMDYRSAWDLQEKLLQQNVRVKSLTGSLQTAVGNEIPDDASPITHHHLLFVEHPPVYTLGKSGHVENILISEADRIEKNIEFYPTNRGGDITFHGPGQIVAYPILDLEKFYTDIGRYLRNLEDVVIDLMSTYGLKGERSAGETGVWLDPTVKGKERKICAMGVRCSRWITMHGLALNVNTDLQYFDHIVPCGIHDKKVTSLAKELGFTLDIEDVKDRMKRSFEKVFEVRIADMQMVG